MSTQDERKLFVAGLPESMTEDALRQLFEEAGTTVVDVSLPRHRDTGKPRGFGFVTLGSPEEASTARGSLDGSLQSGRSISVRAFKAEPPKRDGAPGTGVGGGPAHSTQDRTLYVGNLPFDATPEEVEELIVSTDAGGVSRVHLPTGPDGRARGFGFVTMVSAEAANAAIVGLRDRELKGRKLMVNIAHARGEKPSGDRQDRPPPRRDNGPPRSFDGGGFPPSPGFDAAPPARAESARRERWADKPENKKKKKKRGKSDRTEAAPKRGRSNPNQWKDWDKD